MIEIVKILNKPKTDSAFEDFSIFGLLSCQIVAD